LRVDPHAGDINIDFRQPRLYLFRGGFQSWGNLRLLIAILVIASALAAIPYFICKGKKPVENVEA
jgi:hypothetical protein